MLFILILFFSSLVQGRSRFQVNCLASISNAQSIQELLKKTSFDEAEMNKIRFNWLRNIFPNKNCTQIEKEIQKLYSLSQILPTNKSANLKKNIYTPLMPLEYQEIIRGFHIPEYEQHLYQISFRDLHLFNEFKNIKHTLHYPAGSDETHSLCNVLQELPSIQSVTIHYSNPQIVPWNLNEKEIHCILQNKIRIFIKGDFLPNLESEKFKKNIYGIDNFLGDINTLNQYPNLTFLGLINYSGKSSLRVLTRNRKLTQLHVNSNKIENLEDIGYLTQLNYLALKCIETKNGNTKVCSNNALRDIHFLKELRNLKGLDLSWNNIQDISVIKTLKKIEILNLKCNRINSTEAISGMKSLKFLDISSNNIQEISPLKSLDKLIFLNIANNNIYNIQKLSFLKKLKYLSMGNNPYSLNGFHPSKELKVLNLSYRVPESSFNHFLEQSITPGNPEENDLNWTKINLFDQEVITNSVRTFKNDPFNNYDMTNFEHVQFLKISDHNLKDIPDMSSLKELKYLDLSNNIIQNKNGLQNIPKSIEYLSLNDNGIKNVSFLRNLRKLKFLNLSNNALDLSTFELRSPLLTHLWLDNCKIDNTPELNNSLNITRVSLSKNQLDHLELPLKNLEYLNLRKNYFNSIPNFKEAKRLSFLNFSENKINNFKNFPELSRGYNSKGSYVIMEVYIDVSYNELTELSFFEDKKFNYFEIVLTNNPINKDSTTDCPRTSPNQSVSHFCNSN